MKPIIAINLTALVAFALGLYFDWWTIAIAAFFVAVLIPQKPLLAWVCGFFAIFLLWGLVAFFKSHANENLLAVKIATIFPLGGNPYILIVVAAAVGGLVGGFAALAASYLRYQKKAAPLN